MTLERVIKIRAFLIWEKFREIAQNMLQNRLKLNVEIFWGAKTLILVIFEPSNVSKFDFCCFSIFKDFNFEKDHTLKIVQMSKISIIYG